MSEIRTIALARALISDLWLFDWNPNGPCPRCGQSLRGEADALAHWNENHVESAQEEVAEPEVSGEEVEPEWERFGFRGQVGKLLWARDLKKKAIRFVSCNKCARVGVCSRYPDEHKYFIPNGCEVVFCRECAEETRRALFLSYFTVIWSVVQHGIPKGWVLWRVNFTLRSDGSEITPERVKKFNACVRATMRRAVRFSYQGLRPRGAQNRASGCPFVATDDKPTRSERAGAGHESETAKSPQSNFGMLFVDEVGFEKRGHLPDAQRVAHGLNLHCHGLYFGPSLDWERTRDLWMAETRKQFGIESRGFLYRPIRQLKNDPERAICWALNHMLKYVSKPPAVSPERLASLIAAFNTAKRVHSLRLFYGKKSKREKRDCLCPKCKAAGIVSVVGFEGKSLPNGGCIPRLEQIELLIAKGYVPLRGAGRTAVLSMGDSS